MSKKRSPDYRVCCPKGIYPFVNAIKGMFLTTIAPFDGIEVRLTQAGEVVSQQSFTIQQVADYSEAS